METPAIIDIPDGDENTEELAKNMTEEEARALLIVTFRYAREIVQFTRTLQAMMNEMSKNPMMAAMMPGLPQAENPAMQRLRQSGLVAPNGR